MSKFAIGIDLGTTYSSIAVYRNGKAEVIPNDHGKRSMPSCVTFTPSRKYVGEGAIFQAVDHASNAIYGVKRMIGRSFNDPEVQKDIKTWPFKVIEDDNQIKIEVEFKGETKRYLPEDISADILTTLKKSAEDYLETTINDVVITCPANFNNDQREATMKAAKIAKLNVIRMINEPTAAALAYGLQEKSVSDKTILVFDFGGGTCDISILTINDNKFIIKATSGNTYLGGEDFDQRMVEHFVEEFKEKINRDISNDKGLMRRLKIHCENAKKILSHDPLTSFVFENANLTGTISRACFEELNYDLFQKALKLVENALNNAGMNKSDIDEIVLVGGSSRIPEVQKMLSDLFIGKTLYKNINPDEAVVLGAATQAAALQDQLSGPMKGLKLWEICSLSLGSEVLGGRFNVLIKRNTPIPAKESDNYFTAFDNQTSTYFNIYEGERILAKDNHFLGGFKITELPPKPCGEVKIKVTFEIDDNGILKVTASESSSGYTNSLTILKSARLSKNDAKCSFVEAADQHEEDAKHKERLDVLYSFDDFIKEIRNEIKCMQDKVKAEKIDKFVSGCLDWMVKNHKTVTKEEIEKKHDELKKFWNDNK